MLNKTPKETGKKTKWARNVAITAVGFALILSFIAALRFEDIKAPAADTPAPTSSNTCAGLFVLKTCYPLERAETEEARIKGLSGRSELKAQTGMLFVYDNPGRQCIWMKEMNFNLDIIWLDEAKKITKIKQNVPPSSYPDSYCTDNTKYVIELNSGDAAKLQLADGNKLEF